MYARKSRQRTKRSAVSRRTKSNYAKSGSGAYRFPSIPQSFKPYVRSALKGAGGMLGGAAASYIGAPASYGNKIGRKVGSAISRMIGSGAYVTNDIAHKVNSLFQAKPEYAKLNLGPEDVVIEHREYVRDVYASSVAGAFKVEQITINPGLQSSFPWISGIAMNYESYQMLGCVYEFKSQYSDSTVAAAGTSGTLGEVMMYVDYSVETATLPSSKFAMENSFGSISARVNDCILCGVECMPKYNLSANLLIANAAVTPSNVNQYHLGLVNIASQGVQAASVQIGSIYCHSRIVLRKPKTSTALGDVQNFAHYTIPGGSDLTNRWGTAQTKRAGNITLTFDANRLYFPADITEGLYRVSCNVEGVSGGGTASQIFPTTTNCSLRAIYANGVGYSQAPGAITMTGGALGKYQFECYVDINGPNASLAINNPISNTQMPLGVVDVFVMQESLTYQV